MAKYAIYGFFFSKDFSTKRASFSVINEDIKFYDKVKKTQDRKNYNLSGYIETSESDLEEFVFTMEAVLSFVQQQSVRLVEICSDNIAEPCYECSFLRHGSGAPFAMHQDIQEEIIDKLYEKLLDYNDPCNLKTENSPFDNQHNFEFKSFVYKTLEPMKMRNYSIEIPFYLYFSGLEAFCEQYIKSFITDLKINEKDVRQNIAPVLEKLGINYIFADWPDGLFNWRNKKVDKDEFLKLSISTYSNLRNSLFHQNLFIASTETSTKFKKIDGKQIHPEETVKITDYDYYLHRLCDVVILKYIGLQNQRLDCSKWYTRFPLIS